MCAHRSRDGSQRVLISVSRKFARDLMQTQFFTSTQQVANHILPITQLCLISDKIYQRKTPAIIAFCTNVNLFLKTSYESASHLYDV